jgi:hypothetical protein
MYTIYICISDNQNDRKQKYIHTGWRKNPPLNNLILAISFSSVENLRFWQTWTNFGLKFCYKNYYETGFSLWMSIQTLSLWPWMRNPNFVFMVLNEVSKTLSLWSWIRYPKHCLYGSELGIKNIVFMVLNEVSKTLSLWSWIRYPKHSLYGHEWGIQNIVLMPLHEVSKTLSLWPCLRYPKHCLNAPAWGIQNIVLMVLNEYPKHCLFGPEWGIQTLSLWSWIRYPKHCLYCPEWGIQNIVSILWQQIQSKLPNFLIKHYMENQPKWLTFTYISIIFQRHWQSQRYLFQTILLYDIIVKKWR